MRQAVIARTRNQSTKRSLRTELKAFATAIEAKDGKQAAEALKNVQSNLDKTVKKNLLKKNTAARRMSRLTAQVKALGAKPATVAPKKAAPTKSSVASAKDGKPAAKTASKPVAKKAPAKKPAAAKKTPAK